MEGDIPSILRPLNINYLFSDNASSSPKTTVPLFKQRGRIVGLL
jgi:hypothetical protein